MLRCGIGAGKCEPACPIRQSDREPHSIRLARCPSSCPLGWNGYAALKSLSVCVTIRAPSEERSLESTATLHSKPAQAGAKPNSMNRGVACPPTIACFSMPTSSRLDIWKSLPKHFVCSSPMVLQRKSPSSLTWDVDRSPADSLSPGCSGLSGDSITSAWTDHTQCEISANDWRPPSSTSRRCRGSIATGRLIFPRFPGARHRAGVRCSSSCPTCSRARRWTS